jgi:hypothetical protein
MHPTLAALADLRACRMVHADAVEHHGPESRLAAEAAVAMWEALDAIFEGGECAAPIRRTCLKRMWSRSGRHGWFRHDVAEAVIADPSDWLAWEPPSLHQRVRGLPVLDVVPPPIVRPGDVIRDQDGRSFIVVETEVTGGFDAPWSLGYTVRPLDLDPDGPECGAQTPSMPWSLAPWPL